MKSDAFIILMKALLFHEISLRSVCECNALNTADPVVCEKI